MAAAGDHPASASNVPASLSLLVVYVTVPSRAVGRTIGSTLVQEQLAACVNILPGVESIYRWEGKVQADAEELLLIKTRQSLLPQVTQRVKALHPYEECEVLAVTVAGGSESYMRWVLDSTHST